TAAAALARLAQGDIALLVLDYVLPGGLTGLAFYADLRAAGHALPVIMVTGQSNEATVIEALRLGVNDFITKSREYLDYLPEAVARVLTQVRTARRLAESEQRFRALVQHVADGILVVDTAGRVAYASPAVARILGAVPTHLAGTGATLLHPDELAPMQRQFAALRAAPGATARTTLRLRHRDGGWRHVEATLTNLLAEPGVGGIVCTLHDVTARSALEAQLAHQAFHDALTGLPNRALFTDRLAHALARAARHGETLAVLFCDLDRFKVVNDSLGHAAGDRVLIAVAERLRRCVRADDTVARLGGDEFVILLEGLADSGEAVRVADRIAAALADAVPVPASTPPDVFISASVGIAVATPDHDTATDLLRDADVALYRAKQQGAPRYALFDPLMHAAAAERLALETDLRRAIGPGACAEFLLHYQPIVDLAGGQVAAVEALVRWRHPARGLVAPAAFIPLAEETGLILPLGRWGLETACRRVQAWSGGPGATPPALHVNLSPRQFAQPDLVAAVARVLAATGLPPARLTLEITETVLMAEAAVTTEKLRALTALGVRLAIDDFGTGYSSLAYLQRLPVDTLKIDRAFFQAGGRNRAIVRAVTELAHGLGLAVTAEGLETAEQVAGARAAGCDHGQGYHFARPLPPEAVAALWAGGRQGPLPAAGDAARPLTTTRGADPVGQPPRPG
ncbi:MAG TPA: EAL domain-containing protein, partial [Thermomicrobiales bacterium]|nr:EAL domain-containing protein [Thermomicrobiales bacterium]